MNRTPHRPRTALPFRRRPDWALGAGDGRGTKRKVGPWLLIPLKFLQFLVSHLPASVWRLETHAIARGLVTLRGRDVGAVWAAFSERPCLIRRSLRMKTTTRRWCGAALLLAALISGVLAIKTWPLEVMSSHGTVSISRSSVFVNTGVASECPLWIVLAVGGMALTGLLLVVLPSPPQPPS
jgi:hypothetical protein